MVSVIAVLVLATASVLLVTGVEPVPTWFYVFAWYPTLVLLDGDAARRGGHDRLLARPAWALAVGGWSIVIWLVFEAANFRLRNWYYVFLPAHPVERWAGVALSFATVIPAVLLIERWLQSLGLGGGWRTRPFRPAPAALPWIQVLGCAMAMGALLLPNVLFPLIWGAAWLIADPVVYRRRPEWSLLADIEAGRWGRLGRLLVGGLLIGLLWEFFNAWARGKWVYTVPWLGQTKLFEMPPLGFLGFPFFALEAWSMFHALCTLGLARSTTDASPSRQAAGPLARAGAVMFAVAFVVTVLLGMERLTISSTTPRLEDLPTATASEVHALRVAGYHSVFAIAAADPSELADDGLVTLREAERLVMRARLASLRGIGTRHAGRLTELDIGSVCQLARRSPRSLWTDLRQAADRESVRPTPAEVRVWIGAARRSCVEHSSVPLHYP
jgi:hypothetical protein